MTTDTNTETYFAFVTKNGQTSVIAACPTKEDAINAAMVNLFADLGEGDGDNGGKGSLWNCAPEIYAVLSEGKTYSYADQEWFVGTANPYAKERVFHIGVKRVDMVWMNVRARTMDEAKRKVEEKAERNDWFANWGWDGTEVGISDEDSYEVFDEEADF